MIKRILLAATLSLPLVPGNVDAQELYNFVVESSRRTLDSPTTGYTQTRIAQFKLTALTYLKSQAFERQEEVTETFLSTQAYYLSEFITLFLTEVLDVPAEGKERGKGKGKAKEKARSRTALFMDASLSNPLFSDTDEETTLAYVKEGTEITPFSLDTDWQKAYLAVKEEIDKQ